MGITQQQLRHGRSKVRAINGIIVVFKDKSSIYARNDRISIVIRRETGAIRGTYREWKLLREKLTNRKGLTIWDIQRIAAHYGFPVYKADRFPSVEKDMKLVKEKEYNAPYRANSI